MKEFSKLVDIVRRLRSPQGCKWDRAQKLRNLKTYLLEETYELIDALNGNSVEKVKEEMGDIFLILVFIGEILEEKGKLRIQDVLSGINEKLVSRHPHVFSRKLLRNKKEILQFWIKEKAKKKGRKVVGERLPYSAPSLLLAYLLTKEQKNIGCAPSPQEIIKEIRRLVSQLGSVKPLPAVITKITMHLAQLAGLTGWDIENSLRKLVLKKAGQVRYNDKRSIKKERGG